MVASDNERDESKDAAYIEWWLSLDVDQQQTELDKLLAQASVHRFGAGPRLSVPTVVLFAYSWTQISTHSRPQLALAK